MKTHCGNIYQMKARVIINIRKSGFHNQILYYEELIMLEKNTKNAFMSLCLNKQRLKIYFILCPTIGYPQNLQQMSYFMRNELIFSIEEYEHTCFDNSIQYFVRNPSCF